MHLLVNHSPTPVIQGADIMSDPDVITYGCAVSFVARQADGETYAEARQNLCASLDNKHWRWLLDLWRRTGRK